MCPFIRKYCRFLLARPRCFPRRDADPCLGLAPRFMRDRSGAYAVMFGLMAPVFIGALALGSETGLWFATQAKMQDAADSGAISAAVGSIAGDTNYSLQANATTASDGFVNGSNGTVVTVNNPPLSGPNAGTKGDIEVIIKQPQKLLFSGLFLKSPVVIQARAVAGAPAGVVCVLALNKNLIVPGITAVAAANVLADRCNIADNSPSPLALTEAALASITAQKVNVVGGYVDVLGTMTTTQGVHTGSTPTQDPFAGTTVPSFSGLSCNPYSLGGPAPYGPITGTVTLTPGRYCGGLSVLGGANVALSPGTYYLDEGLVGLLNFSVALGATVTGTGGVTVVMTPSNPLLSLPATLLLAGVINLTAPTSGQFANLVFFVPPGALLSALTFAGPQANFVGTIYAPGSAVVYALGGPTHTGQCTRLIADTMVFAVGGASFSKCAVTSASAAPAQLLE